MGIALMSSMLLAGCGNRATTPNKDQFGGQTADKSNSQPTLKVVLQHGKYQQAAGLLSVPVVMANKGTNSTLVDSNNFTLHIGKYTFKPYQLGGEPADFHYNFAANNTWQNTISFNIGTHLTKQELKSVKLTYKTDNGKTITASHMDNTISQSKTRVNMQHAIAPIDLGTYYQQSEKYLTEVNKMKAHNANATVPSLDDRFQDDRFDQFKLWVAIPSTGDAGSKTAALKFYNGTRKDFFLPYGDFELVDKDGNEIQVDPSYRNYQISIPHGKYTTVTVPMESKLTPADGPYHVEVRVDASGTSPSSSFFDTTKGFNAAEVMFSNEVDIDTLFSMSADKYPADKIKWANQQVDTANNEVRAQVTLADYYNLANHRANYHLITTNDDGSKRAFTVKKVSPKYVMTTSPKTITWHINKLGDAMNYQHVTLQSNGKTILQLK